MTATTNGNDSGPEIDAQPIMPESLDTQGLYRAVQDTFKKAGGRFTIMGDIESLTWEPAGQGDPNYTDVRSSGSPLELFVKIVPLWEHDGRHKYRFAAVEGSREPALVRPGEEDEFKTNLLGWAEYRRGYAGVIGPDGIEPIDEEVRDEERRTSVIEVEDVVVQAQIDEILVMLEDCRASEFVRAKFRQSLIY